MLASGLWHGAGLNFIAWGAWHAALLCAHRLWSRRPGIRVAVVHQGVAMQAGSMAMVKSWATTLSSWALTYVMVNLGWVFFAMDWDTSMIFFHRLITG